MITALTLCLLALSTVPQERRAVPLPDIATRTASVAPLRLELYDVSRVVGLVELERALGEFAARGAQGAAADAALDFETLERRRTQFELQRDGLLGALRGSMQPPAGEGTRVEWLPNGRVAVLAEPAQHDWVREFLARPQAFDGMIELATVLWKLPAEPAAKAFVARHRERLGSAEAGELMARLDALGAERITAPRVLSFAFAPIHLRAGEELHYIGDWEFLELTDRAGTVPAPLVKSAFEGFELRSTSYPTAHGRLQIEVELAYKRLVRPIASLETTFGGRTTTPVVVQLPEWSGVNVTGRVELAPDESLLLAAEDPATGRVVVALMRARTVAALEER